MTRRQPTFLIVLVAAALSSVVRAQTPLRGPALITSNPVVLELWSPNILAPAPANECVGAPCSGHYEVLDVSALSAATIPSITAVTRIGNFTLGLTLSTALDPVRDFVLVARALEFVKSDGTRDSGRAEFWVGPELLLVPDGQDQTLEIRLARPIVSLPALDTVSVTVGDPEREVVHPRTVTRLVPDGTSPYYSVKLVLDRPLPPGRKLAVSVTGLGDRKAKASLGTIPIPKTRDEATLHLSVSRIWNDEGDDRYTYDLKYKRFWGAWPMGTQGVWHAGVSLDGQVSDKKAKLRNDVTVGVLAKYSVLWLPESAEASRIEATAGPTVWSDRDRDNVDVGLDLDTLGIIGAWNETLWERRREAAQGKSTNWGYTVRPGAGFEVGTHERSASADVEGESFLRARGSLVVAIEWRDYTLSSRYDVRESFDDEAVLTSSGDLVRTESGTRHFVRSELARDLGYFKLGLILERGRKPPTFAPVDSLSLAVVVKR